MIPGEVETAAGEVTLNEGREAVTLMVANAGDRPVQVGSHYHFAEANGALEFDREAARGRRLNIAAGTAVRFEPGQRREVSLVPFGGDRVVHGFNGRVGGALALALALLWAPGARAQDACAGAVTQADLNDCSFVLFEEADADLNAAWGDAVAKARAWDKADGQAAALGAVAAPVPLEDALRAAQRAWIAFRDATCAAESGLIGTGSMRAMVEAGCLERVTRARTEDLLAFAAQPY